MKRKVVIGALAFVSAAFVGSTAPTAEAAAGNYYWMVCRGDFSVRTSGWTQIEAKKAASKGGNDGASLKAGECAWTDRALNASENAKIVFAVPANPTSYQLLTAAQKTAALIACSESSRCIVSAKVRNDGTGNLESGPYPVTIRWVD